MVRTKDRDGIMSSLIISEVQKRPCLYDTNHPHYGDRAEKAHSWEEVCENVVPGWSILGLEHKFAAGKEVQKRWRSIRDSFTKAYRQGKCVPAEQCAPGSRRHQYIRQHAFLLKAFQNKKPRHSQDKYDSFSELSNSPQHQTEDGIVKEQPTKQPEVKTEQAEAPEKTPNKRDKTQQTERRQTIEKTQQLNKTQPNKADKAQKLNKTIEKIQQANKSIDKIQQNNKSIDKIQQANKSIDKIQQANKSIDKTQQTNKSFDKPQQKQNADRNQPKDEPKDKMETPEKQKDTITIPIEIKNQIETRIDANTIHPDDYFDDDKSFMNSLIPLFKKMDDDTRLLCRIEVLKIIRYALQGHRGFEALRMAEDRFFQNDLSRVLLKEEPDVSVNSRASDSTFSMVTRSADGTRTARKRMAHSPIPTRPGKKRGPGRPRKVQPPASDSDSEAVSRRQRRQRSLLPVASIEPRLTAAELAVSRATTLTQLGTPEFMKMYNLERSKNAPQLYSNQPPPSISGVSVKSEPVEYGEQLTT